MSVSREIAQARTYSSAFGVLSYQMLGASVVVAFIAPSWWWSLFVPIVFGVMAMFKPTRILILISLSSFWALLVQQLALEGISEIMSYVFAFLAFILTYAINNAGMTGLQDAVPDLKA